MARKMPGETAIRERFEEVAAIYREICTAPEYAVVTLKKPRAFRRWPHAVS